MDETTLAQTPPAGGSKPARLKRAIMLRCDPDHFFWLHLRAKEAHLSLNQLLRIALGGVPGCCQVCACTDDRGCEDGCMWANEQRTLCSRSADHLVDRSQWNGLGSRIRAKGSSVRM